MKFSGAVLLAVILAVILAASSTSAEAVSTVNAEATFDWTGFTFTTTGTLSATMIAQASQGASTSTSATPTTQGGSATAAASAVNGFLTISAGALTTSGGGFPNVGQADVFASSIFWFYGTGAGSLVVTVPYRLELISVATSDNDITSASAWVNLFTGPGVGSNSDSFVSDALSLTGAGAMSRDGVLTASQPLFNPTFGPLVSLDLQAEVRASAAVPETTSSLVLLTLGLLVIGALLAVPAARNSGALTSRH
jgi:hypothetical protein